MICSAHTNTLTLSLCVPQRTVVFENYMRLIIISVSVCHNTHTNTLTLSLCVPQRTVVFEIPKLKMIRNL